MRRALPIPALAAIAVLCALLGPSVAGAAVPGYLVPTEVWEEGGSGWQPQREILVLWRRGGAPVTSPAPTAVDSLVRDVDGNVVVPPRREPWHADRHLFVVPATPGIYTAEFWLEGEPSQEASHGTAALRFDDTRPGAPRAEATAAWFAAGEEPSLRIQGAEGPPPIAGLRGYAVSIDRGEASSPCADANVCTDAEVDLAAEQSPGLVRLGALPQGLNLVRVATVSNSGMHSTTRAVAVRVDLEGPRVRLRGAPNGWAAEPVQLTAVADDALSGMAPSGPSGAATMITVDGRATVMSPGSSANTTVGGDGTHTILYSARDAAGNLSGFDTRSHSADPSATAVVRIDETAPQIAFSRSQDPSEPERIEARVSDRLSGPDSSRGTIAVRPAESTAAFQPLPTRTSEGRLTALWDSDSYPRGSYEFRATGYDLAGNPGSGDRRADGTRMVLANPLKRAATVEFGFGGRRLVWQRCARVGEGRRCRRQVIEDFENRPQTRSTAYAGEIAVGGRLTSAGGTPLPQMPVEIVERFDGGSTIGTRVTTVRSNAEGRFALRLPPGPSRRIEAVFEGNRVLARTHSTALRLGVLASVRLGVSSPTARIGGRPVIFSGRIGGVGAKVPSGGRPVELQFRLPGLPWSEFRTVQTDAHGGFRYPYAFADDDSRGIRFQFRAVTPAAEGWPYETGTSRPVFVTGH